MIGRPIDVAEIVLINLGKFKLVLGTMVLYLDLVSAIYDDGQYLVKEIEVCPTTKGAEALRPVPSSKPIRRAVSGMREEILDRIDASPPGYQV
jgi:hypothetical protein